MNCNVLSLICYIHNIMICYILILIKNVRGKLWTFLLSFYDRMGGGLISIHGLFNFQIDNNLKLFLWNFYFDFKEKKSGFINVSCQGNIPSLS